MSISVTKTKVELAGIKLIAHNLLYFLNFGIIISLRFSFHTHFLFAYSKHCLRWDSCLASLLFTRSFFSHALSLFKRTPLFLHNFFLYLALDRGAPLHHTHTHTLSLSLSLSLSTHSRFSYLVLDRRAGRQAPLLHTHTLSFQTCFAFSTQYIFSYLLC